MIYPTLIQPAKFFQAILLAYISNKAASSRGQTLRNLGQAQRGQSLIFNMGTCQKSTTDPFAPALSKIND